GRRHLPPRAPPPRTRGRDGNRTRRPRAAARHRTPLMARFVAVGEVMLDIAAEELVPGGIVHAPIRVRPGGSSVTAAVAAAMEGVEAAVVGRVGDDLAGRAVREA